VDVRIVFDAGKQPIKFPRCGADPARPGTREFLAKLDGKIQTKAITGGDPNLPKLMHHKYVIRDGKTAEAAVWTGSTNWTEDAWTLQENNIICIQFPELCSWYEKDFAELWAKGDIALTGANDSARVKNGTISIDVAFSPGDGRIIDHEIAQHIALAKKRLRLCSMLLTSGAILGALNDVIKHRDLDYGGIYDQTQMAEVLEQWRGQPSEWKIAAFKTAVAPLTGKRSSPYTPDGVHDFMHNKVLVADDTVITGSYNFSHSAMENAENVLMIQDPELADRYVAYIQQLVTRYKGNQS
jgi:phosphatidylserine/phosphatidylglycerophosphate/cardiolipin synthase-like enzyme